MLTSPTLKTLAYHAKFNYPLTLDELHRFLLINHPVSSNEVKSELIDLTKQKKIVKKNNFYYLPNHPNLPNIRLKRRESSLPKLRLAARAARLIGFLPWIKLVCVTGSLAMENSGPDDDIDLMIVTSPSRLWLTRPLVILLISLFFKRRTPITNNKTTISHFANALCLNLWLDSSTLAMPPHRQDLRTAHELAQMKPLINKNFTYEKILAINFSWAKVFLANFWKGLSLAYLPAEKRPTSRERIVHEAGEWQAKVGAKESPYNKTNNLLNLFNHFLFRLQYSYMKSKITSEEVNLHSAFFHPVRKSQLSSAGSAKIR